jgi:hypothetical protein
MSDAVALAASGRYARPYGREDSMKPIRLRTMMIASVVVSVSAVTGLGLGQLLTKIVKADDLPKGTSVGTAAMRGSAQSRTPRYGRMPGGTSIGPAGDEVRSRAAAAGVRLIYPNPALLNFPNPPNADPTLIRLNGFVVPIPQWQYNITASAEMGGGNFTGSVFGRSPFARGKTTTTINTQIVPLIITINDGTTTVTYDPTAADPCVPGHTDVDVITGSPIFTNNPWTMNGVNVGNTQYLDAFQRAQFWSLVGGTNYHLMLQPTVLASQALTFSGGGSSGSGTNYDANALFGGCGSVGVVNINNLDAAVKALITGPLAAMVNAGTLPIFLTKNVVSAETGHSIFSNCCILGYHSAFAAGPDIQVYSPFSLDTSGTFGGDVSTLSHEIGEAINDPAVNNGTPLWGNIGQVLGGCQGNLEVGDPLSPGFGTPTNEFSVVGGNGLTYHLQELAYDTWFFGAPSLGAGAPISSNNGTFTGPAKPCPPGGTH